MHGGAVWGVFDYSSLIVKAVVRSGAQMMAWVFVIVPGIGTVVMKQYYSELHHNQKHGQDEKSSDFGIIKALHDFPPGSISHY
jgi:hypothetical protein